MIKNLQRQLNEAGKIKIGIKGKQIKSANGVEFRPPVKLDHFQLTTTEKDENGDYIVDTDLQDKIKKAGSGIVNKDGNLTGLPVRLVYNDLESNFPHRYVSYISGKLSCHGDGEISKKRLDDFQKDHKCPCNRVEPGYDENDKCKATGSLSCVIDEAGLFGQAHKFRTTGMNTIKGIIGGIELLKEATGGRIAWLPLMLTMNAKQTATPGGISTTVYVVSVCFRGNVEMLRGEVLKLITTDKQYLLDIVSPDKNPIPVVGSEDEKEFGEEFFPEDLKDGDVIDIEPVKEEQLDLIKEEITEKDPGQGQSNDLMSQEEVEKKTDIKGILEPVSTYKKTYDKLMAETDLDEALKIANRLQKGNLIYWMVNNYPDVEFQENIKKPDLLELMRDVLTTVLKKGLVETDDGWTGTKEPGQDESAKDQGNQEGSESEKENEDVPRDWDESDPITNEQLRELVRLKGILEKQGVLRPDKWTMHVNYFVDENGQEISKAVNLTTDQGENFITMLGNQVKTEEEI